MKRKPISKAEDSRTPGLEGSISQFEYRVRRPYDEVFSGGTRYVNASAPVHGQYAFCLTPEIGSGEHSGGRGRARITQEQRRRCARF